MVSLRFVRMALKNSAFQQWRDLVASADFSNHPGRLSAPYMVPKRKAPAYLKLRRSTQARFVQFFTGRSAIPQFLSLIKPDQYSDQCPCGTGPGGVHHYIEDCPHTQGWRDAVATAQAMSRGINARVTGAMVSTQQAVDQYVPHVLALLDHTSLGSDSWTRERGSPHTNTAAAFWKPVHHPLTTSFYHQTTEGWNMVDLTNYFPELWKRWDRHFIPDPPPKEFYPWILNHAQLHPSRGFHDGWSDLPRMRLHQHAAPRHGTRPLNNAEQHLEAEPPPVAPQLRCSARVAAQRAAHQPVLSPPGQPPDRWAWGDFSLSSPIL